MNNAALYADLDQVRAQIIVLADMLNRPPGSGPIELETPRGLSLIAWHIIQDIDCIQREIENEGEA
ncbi:MAG: hypothetical protein LBQ57_13315 [Spirochaetales bacterium]|jgi:hypothetical protein|nr:hypothetical protein [Spirochaetales bacterium]